MDKDGVGIKGFRLALFHLAHSNCQLEASRVAPVCGWLFVLQVTANGHLDEVQELAKLSSSGERPCT